MVLKIPLVSVSLATVALESCFYGVYLVLGITSISLLLGRTARSRRGGSSIYTSPIFIGAIGLFCTITAHWILTVNQAFSAFIHFPAEGKPALAFYAELSQINHVVKTGFLVATITIGDALIIHRLWVVWGYNKYVVIFPAATLTGLAVCGVGITYQFARFKTGQNVFLSEAGRWITSNSTFTLCTNIYSTGMISWRLWDQARGIQPNVVGRSLKSVLIILIESAAIYTSWGIFFFSAYESESNLQSIAIDCWPAITGISCMLIHVRVGLGWAQEGTNKSTAASSEPPKFAVNITRDTQTTDSGYPLDEIGRREGKSDV
ncbi:hypothetical protein B0H12DRAFT_1099535 [Mycena haematopus]|nr:hypothetical protein B0H12DRAFT_1099535 [Mycena haematopus]